MTRYMTCLGLTALPLSALAALAPVHQNRHDLAVLVEFVQQHPEVLQSLRSIDLQQQVVHFGRDCVARFGRATVAEPRPGGAPALAFTSATCPVGPAEGVRGAAR